MTEAEIQAMLTMTPAQLLAILKKVDGGITAVQSFITSTESSPMAPAIMALIQHVSPATAALLPVLKEIGPLLPFLLNMVESVESVLKPA